MVWCMGMVTEALKIVINTVRIVENQVFSTVVYRQRNDADSQIYYNMFKYEWSQLQS